MKPQFAVLAMALVVSGAVQAQVPSAEPVALPGPVKRSHPHLYTNQAAVDHLRTLVPAIIAFPTKGAIEFSFKPVQNSGGQRNVFGDWETADNIYMRHAAEDKPGAATFQFGLTYMVGTTKTYLPGTNVDLPLDQVTKLRVEWTDTEVRLYGNGRVVSKVSRPAGWNPGVRHDLFRGHPGDVFSEIKLTDASGANLLNVPTLNPALNTAWHQFAEVTLLRKQQLERCSPTDLRSGDDICKTATGGRGSIPRPAQLFALMYLLTGSQDFLTTAKTYSDRLTNTPPGADGEWSGSGRLSAMALLYDWLYEPLGATYREKLVKAIKENIVAAALPPAQGEDQRTSILEGICGRPFELPYTAGSLDCPPTFTFDGSTTMSIADEYLGGHPSANVAAVTMALMAIGGEQSAGDAMLRTMYNHYHLGFWKAMEYVAVDGGHHQSWGYASSATPAERLLIWRAGLEPAKSTEPIFPAPWSEKMIKPFIYGYRGDKFDLLGSGYPASGDFFPTQSWLGTVGQLARSAMVSGGEVSGPAADFYNNIVLAARAGRRGSEVGLDTLLEHLYWPVSDTSSSTPDSAPQNMDELPKSAYFRTAGRVLARDTWDFDNATLFEFKSSNLATINHQHLDQNSFTLFYKAPLALDSGALDKYGSTHWHSYYIRSIAHNTVTLYDEKEVFSVTSGEPMSNDGGQWFVNGQVRNPTLAQIATGKPNYLHGIGEYYEHMPTFTYVRGNASASYSNTKLAKDNGFLRSALFLQPTASWSKPVLVVFDQVTPVATTLSPKFLLHTANPPEPGYGATLGKGTEGQYAWSFTGDRRIATVRNGEGAMTMETLLPKSAAITSVGGIGLGQSCTQYLKTGTEPTTDDCRFMVRIKKGTETVWRNFAPAPTDQTPLTDAGAWRLEVMAPAAQSGTQLFLNVFTVADNNEGAAITPVATQLVSAADGTEAVMLGNYSLVVAFNKALQPATSLSWYAKSESSRFIATGLIPNTNYTREWVPGGTGGKMTVRLPKAGETSLYRSTAAGVIGK